MCVVNKLTQRVKLAASSARRMRLALIQGVTIFPGTMLILAFQHVLPQLFSFVNSNISRLELSVCEELQPKPYLIRIQSMLPKLLYLCWNS